LEELRVTCGSEVRSQEPASSSDESEANDWDVVDGGKIRSLMLLERHRGMGMES
jgi:hypothetical protein